MKPFYVYDRNIFRPGRLFFKSHATAAFGRVCDGRIEFCHPVTFNNWGFRDDVSYTARRDAKEVRIAAIGDSFTTNLDCEKAWPRLLEEILKRGGGSAVQVFNLGLTGAGPANWVGLEDVVRQIAPDMILLTFYERILERPLIGFCTDERKRRFYCRYGEPELFSRPVGICDARFPQLSKMEFERYAEELEKENQQVKVKIGARLRAWVHARLYGLRPTALSNQEHVKRMLTWAPNVILAAFPSQAGFASQDAAEEIQTSFLADLAKDRGLLLLDFKHLLRSQAAEALYSDSTHHWTSRGNAAVAEIFAKHLLTFFSRSFHDKVHCL